MGHQGAGAAMRRGPQLDSEKKGEVPVGNRVRVEHLMEIAEKKMRAHIVEADGVQGTMEGWVSTKLLQCLSAECGHCFQCSDGLVPTDAAIKQENDANAKVKCEGCNKKQTEMDKLNEEFYAFRKKHSGSSDETAGQLEEALRHADESQEIIEQLHGIIYDLEEQLDQASNQHSFSTQFSGVDVARSCNTILFAIQADRDVNRAEDRAHASWEASVRLQSPTLPTQHPTRRLSSLFPPSRLRRWRSAFIIKNAAPSKSTNARAPYASLPS